MLGIWLCITVMDSVGLATAGRTVIASLTSHPPHHHPRCHHHHPHQHHLHCHHYHYFSLNCHHLSPPHHCHPHTTIVICHQNRNFDTNQRLLDYKQQAKDGVSFSGGRWNIAGKWRSGRLGLSWREPVEQSQSLWARAALGSLSKFSALPPILNSCTQPFRSCGLIINSFEYSSQAPIITILKNPASKSQWFWNRDLVSANFLSVLHSSSASLS